MAGRGLKTPWAEDAGCGCLLSLGRCTGYGKLRHGPDPKRGRVFLLLFFVYPFIVPSIVLRAQAPHVLVDPGACYIVPT